MATKRKSLIQQHVDNKCDCTHNPGQDNTCIYQCFVDGWDFTPDVGRGQTSGEIFTPRFIVDKMITTSGMFPEAVVYHNDFTECTEEDLEHMVGSTVCEPATGTGNFISTILHHKLQAAYELATRRGQDIDHLVPQAVGTVYAYDIDAGNLETTLRRLTRHDGTPLDDKHIVKYWVDHIVGLIVPDSDRDQITTTVQTSLTEAQHHWATQLRSQGVLAAFLNDHHAGDSEDLLVRCEDILRENIKIFNGIVNDHTPTMPGVKDITWTFWDSGVMVEKRSMYHEMVTSKIATLDTKIAKLKEEHYIDGAWDDNQTKKEHAKLTKEKNKLAKELD